MSKYTVEVFTGEVFGSGTSNKIYIKFIGSECNTEFFRLRSMTGFWAGSKQTFTLKNIPDIGKLLVLELESKHAFGLCDNDWFVSKIIVTTPDSGPVLFPCHRWIKSSRKVYLRDALGKLKSQDQDHELIVHRHENLKRRRQDYKWSVYSKEMPFVVQAENACQLTPEVKFSFTKDTEFLYNSGSAFMKLKFQCPDSNTWTSFKDLDKFLTYKSKTYEYVSENWKNDEFFGYQFLNGLNPMMIQRCEKLPENFPVTNDMVGCFLERSTLKEEMKNGNIFLCNYERLRDLEGNTINKKPQYLAAPLCLLFSNGHGQLMPIAIQLNQELGEENPIFLPNDKLDWLLAKIFVRNAEFNEHELNFHLLRTHLLGEVFTVAMMRKLPSCHPLFKLLLPHTRYTLQINIMARSSLISVDGVFPQFTAIGNDSMHEFMKRAVSSLTYSSLCLPDDIKERGVEKIPNYYYRDDGLDLWEIINKLVKGFVSHYYTNDNNVKEDTELQDWLTEILDNGKLGDSSAGFPKSFSTMEELTKFITMVMFTVSAQHAAVNNGQFDFGGWMPNFPSSLREPPPSSKGNTTEASIFATLPDVRTTLNSTAVVYLLSQESSDRYPLGHYPEESFSEAKPLTKILEFQAALRNLEKKINERNQKLSLPYTYLNPKNVENSIAI